MCLLLFRPRLPLTLNHTIRGGQGQRRGHLGGNYGKGWDKTFVQSLNKEKRENAFGLMVKSHITEKRCSNPGCSFHKQKMVVDLSKVDLDHCHQSSNP